MPRRNKKGNKISSSGTRESDSSWNTIYAPQKHTYSSDNHYTNDALLGWEIANVDNAEVHYRTRDGGGKRTNHLDSVLALGIKSKYSEFQEATDGAVVAPRSDGTSPDLDEWEVIVSPLTAGRMNAGGKDSLLKVECWAERRENGWEIQAGYRFSDKSTGNVSWKKDMNVGILFVRRSILEAFPPSA